MVSHVPRNSYQDDSIEPPKVGLIRRCEVRTLLMTRRKFLSSRGTVTAAHEDWFEERKYWVTNEDTTMGMMVKWPENDGYE